jgi:PAS domain-containing protein
MDQAEEPVGDGAISPTAEERLRAMVQLAFDAVLIADEQFDLVFVSQAFVDLFGFDADYWVGRNGFDFLTPTSGRSSRRSAPCCWTRPANWSRPPSASDAPTAPTDGWSAGSRT